MKLIEMQLDDLQWLLNWSSKFDALQMSNSDRINMENFKRSIKTVITSKDK
jgi:hypothetical protein